jgi:hypothetical protein
MDRVDGCLWGCVRFRCQLLNWQDGSDSIWKKRNGPLVLFLFISFRGWLEKRTRKRSRKKERKRGRSAETFFSGSERREETEKGGEKMIYFCPPASGCSPLYPVHSFVRSFVYYTGAITRQRATAVIQTPTPSFFIYSP